MDLKNFYIKLLEHDGVCRLACCELGLLKDLHFSPFEVFPCKQCGIKDNSSYCHAGLAFIEASKKLKELDNIEKNIKLIKSL